jgi:hypothetical protein
MSISKKNKKKILKNSAPQVDLFSQINKIPVPKSAVMKSSSIVVDFGGT